MGKGIYSAQWRGKITHFTTGQQRIHKEQQDIHKEQEGSASQMGLLWSTSVNIVGKSSRKDSEETGMKRLVVHSTKLFF